MTLANIYLVCFLVGFLLSVLTLILGHVDFNFHTDLPHLDGHFHTGAHAGGAPDAGGHGGHGEGSLSPLNFATVTAFLAWFGGTGYILTRYTSLWRLPAAAFAVLLGVGGAAVVFWFFRKLVSAEHVMDPADYLMVGVLGRITSPVRAGGTGEITYVQGGTRHAAGARSEDGAAIARNEEVVVIRYEKGIAYVRRWTELTEELASNRTNPGVRAVGNPSQDKDNSTRGG